MKIQKDFVDDITVLTLTGELDSRGNQLLDKELKELTREGRYKIILDIAAIRFLGSQTLSLLLANLKEVRAGGGNIKILNAQRAVLQYLKSNRIIELFEFFVSRAEAINSYLKTERTSSESTSSRQPPLNASNIVEKTASETITPTIQPSEDAANRFETGEILYANSCMLATLIKLLETKGVLTAAEASELMNYESLSLKGVAE